MSDRIGLKIRILDNLIQKKICHLMNQNGPSELTYMNFWVIGLVKERHPQEVYQKDIEEHLSINRATASKMLTTMERKGLICRVSSEKDRRLRRIVLLPPALDYYEANRAVTSALEETLTRGVDREEIEAFLRLYGKIRANLEG